MINNNWTAALVESLTQARKTNKTFEVLSNKLHGQKGCILGLFITQANSTMSAMQIMNRIKNNEDLLEIFPKDDIIRSADINDDFEANLMIVDFWNTRNTDKMLNVVKDYHWNKIIIVYDECDCGSLYNRLCFAQEVEKHSETDVNIIFITATISNLSDSVYKIYLEDKNKFKNSIVEKIISEKCIEKHHAKPHPSYIGTSWYKNTPGAWRELDIPEKKPDETKSQNDKNILNTICKSLKALPDDNKQLAFVVTSTIRSDHKKLANRMFRVGFNVTIELNCTNNKNYSVMYNSESGETKEWKIPYGAIEKSAMAGELKTYTTDDDGLDLASGIEGAEDLTLSHVLQASLRMGTTFHKNIMNNSANDEKLKLLSIFRKLKNLSGEFRRPHDYPKEPKIAMICGSLASRGNTFQNTFIDFTFTACLYYNTGKSPQRGAINTQMIGRSNGTLLETYTNPNGIMPIMICTKTIMRDSLANEEIVLQRADEIENGELISLKELVTDVDWKKALNKANEKLEVVKIGANKINPIKIGSITTIPENAVLGTTFETLSNAEFQKKYNLDSIPDDPKLLSKLMEQAGINCNISFKQSSSMNVSNLLNYYTNPTWASSDYQIIKIKNGFNIIKRIKPILDNVTPGIYIIAHNYNGKMILYKM